MSVITIWKSTSHDLSHLICMSPGLDGLHKSSGSSLEHEVQRLDVYVGDDLGTNLFG